MHAEDPISRPPVPIQTTVYDAFPSLAALHAVDRTHYPDMRESFFWDVFEKWKPYTCLSVERFYNIFKSIEYIAHSGIPGDIIECGVFLGGSIVGAAQFAKHFGIEDRRFYMFDTFEGFPISTIETDISGAAQDLSSLKIFNNSFRHIVERNIEISSISKAQFTLVQGKVEETLKRDRDIQEVAYLRLDTDYFASTLVELEILYPKLSQGGVFIIDDYGHFEGARAAVDSFFQRLDRQPLLQRIDYTGRCGVRI
jgi:O-methyltransferase